MYTQIKNRLTIFLICSVLLLVLFSGCSSNGKTDLSNRVHAFYYPWYGNPEFDGEYIHWRHSVMGDVIPHTFPGGEDIGADFYPMDGSYSSHDPAIIHNQMRQLQQAGIGVISVSWLGQNSFEGEGLPLLMDIAAEHGILINFHIEPVVQKNVTTIREAIVYLTDKYGQHPAFYRDQNRNGRSLFYVYDSQNTPSEEWTKLLSPNGSLTIRGTEFDADVVGLLVNKSDKQSVLDSHFDGFYSYFAANGFSYASTTYNWPELSKWAKEHDLLFIPSAGPGYGDRRIRPWNEKSQRSREGGKYYDFMFSRAILADSHIIGITSFNEWHEGTQIEPAVPKEIENFKYLDYLPLEPDSYLNRTAHWIGRWEDHIDGNNPVKEEDFPSCGENKKGEEKHRAVGKTIHLDTAYSPDNAAGGDSALIDGQFGSLRYNDGNWQGYHGVDLNAVIDLGKKHQLEEVSIQFIQDRMNWIFLPKRVSLEFSEDGIKYLPVAELEHSISPNEDGPLRYGFLFSLNDRSVRFVRLFAENIGNCPDDHPGKDKPAFLFADEIVVR
jgi:glycoprotein endo-alpha-1,2-mannosidase